MLVLEIDLAFSKAVLSYCLSLILKKQIFPELIYNHFLPVK